MVTKIHIFSIIEKTPITIFLRFKNFPAQILYKMPQRDLHVNDNYLTYIICQRLCVGAKFKYFNKIL